MSQSARKSLEGKKNSIYFIDKNGIFNVKKNTPSLTIGPNIQPYDQCGFIVQTHVRYYAGSVHLLARKAYKKSLHFDTSLITFLRASSADPILFT
jgi:hypothetical protein